LTFSFWGDFPQRVEAVAIDAIAPSAPHGRTPSAKKSPDVKTPQNKKKQAPKKQKTKNKKPKVESENKTNEETKKQSPAEVEKMQQNMEFKKGLGMTPTQFMNAFNAFTKKSGISTNIPTIILTQGSVNDTFTHSFTPNIVMVGVMQKADKRLLSFLNSRGKL
jgi:outer membrane biosynthesis protein TonB